VQSISIELGDRDDDYCIVPAISDPLTLSGGAGRDTGLYCGLDRPAVSLDNDDVADDGPMGRDNIRSDVERLLGTGQADQLGSGSRGAEISAGDGADSVTGGSGPDRVFAAYVEDVGTESGTFYAQGTDTVSCGGGQDLVFADALDALAGDCEATARPRGSGFLFSGSSGADFIVAPYGWSPARIVTRGGRDRIETGSGGTNRISAGRGNDTIRDGGISGNTLFAGPGNDVIVMRDDPNVRSTRDIVDCGKGRDRVYLDRTRDRAARDCERVVRR
jgi:RTX calcium-binding nonapeptide repeat (4 copies)